MQVSERLYRVFNPQKRGEPRCKHSLFNTLRPETTACGFFLSFRGVNPAGKVFHGKRKETRFLTLLQTKTYVYCLRCVAVNYYLYAK